MRILVSLGAYVVGVVVSIVMLHFLGVNVIGVALALILGTLVIITANLAAYRSRR